MESTRHIRFGFLENPRWLLFRGTPGGMVCRVHKGQVICSICEVSRNALAGHERVPVGRGVDMLATFALHTNHI